MLISIHDSVINNNNYNNYGVNYGVNTVVNTGVDTGVNTGLNPFYQVTHCCHRHRRQSKSAKS